MSKTPNCSTSTTRMTFWLWPASVSGSSLCPNFIPSKKQMWMRLKPLITVTSMQCPPQITLVKMFRLEMIPMTVNSMSNQLVQSTLRPQSTRISATWRWLIEERSIMPTISRWSLIEPPSQLSKSGSNLFLVHSFTINSNTNCYCINGEL